MRGEIQGAKSDLEEALEQHKGDGETEAAYAVVAGLGALKRTEADELWSWVPNHCSLNSGLLKPHDNRKLAADHPSHPLVQDVTQKADMFDQYASTYAVPVHAKTVSV